MKLKNYIAALLSVYMITLILLPCNDTCNSHDQITPTTIQAAQDHHQADNDFCSPFCFCSCCATAMTAIHFPVFNTIPSVSVKDFTTFHQSFLSMEDSSIWQPPKFS